MKYAFMAAATAFVACLAFADPPGHDEVVNDLVDRVMKMRNTPDCDDPLFSKIDGILTAYEKDGKISDSDQEVVKKWLFGLASEGAEERNQPTPVKNKRALVIGGSGEDFDKNNFFKKDFEKIKSRFEARDWSVDIRFDGSKHKLGDAPPASNKEVDRALNQLVENSKQGDEALIFIHSHGLPGKWDQTSHHVMTEDPGGYDVDKIAPQLDALKAKGVKVALVDLTCYSGRTQAVARDGVCVVTLGAKDYVTNCSFPENVQGFTNEFINLPSKEKAVSLEEQFLAARRIDTKSSNLPQISSVYTPAVRAWNQFLEKTDPDSYKRKEALKPVDPGLIMFIGRRCGYSDIQKLIQMHHKALGIVGGEAVRKGLEPHAKRVHDRMKEYGELHEKIQDVMKRLKTGYVAEWGFKGDLEPLNGASLVDLRSFLQLTSDEVDVEAAAWLDEGTKNLVKDLKGKRGEIQTVIDEAKKKNQEVWDEYDKLEEAYRNKAHEVLAAERGYFDEHQKIAGRKDGKNPCASFSL